MLTMLLSGVLLPAAVTAAILLPATRPWRQSPEGRAAGERAARWAGALALGLGFATGFFACSGWTGFPPAEHWRWIVWLVVGGAVAGAVCGISRLPMAARAIVAAVAVGVLGWLMVPAFADARRTWQAASVALVAGVWLAPAWTASRAGNRATVIAWLTCAVGLALFLLVANTARFAQLAGVLAACLGTVLLLALWQPALPISKSIALPGASAALALALTAMFYDSGRVPPVAFVLAGGAPAFLALGSLFRVERLGGWRSGAVHAVITLLPIATAIILALRAATASDGSDYEMYY
jgi:hypothetical protein